LSLPYAQCNREVAAINDNPHQVAVLPYMPCLVPVVIVVVVSQLYLAGTNGKTPRSGRWYCIESLAG
jgi:hypothetical protein